MSEIRTLGPWIRRFFLEYLAIERNLARNTQASYRDAFKLLLPFLSVKLRKPVDRLAVQDLTSKHVLEFLRHLETDRGCSPRTRNQRLAAIRSLARFIAREDVAYVELWGQLRAIHQKKSYPEPDPEKSNSEPEKSGSASFTWLTKEEIDALLDVPDCGKPRGRVEHALLLFFVNTGARVSEATKLTVGDVQFGSRSGHRPSVTLNGKGGKMRQTPVWPTTEQELEQLVAGRADSDAVFQNRNGEPYTRHGVYDLVRRTATRAPALAKKRVTPHVLRHTAGCMMVRAGVDINTIRVWLGHASIDTTNIYVEIDLQMKREAMALCDPLGEVQERPWKEDKGVIGFLDSL